MNGIFIEEEIGLESTISTGDIIHPELSENKACRLVVIYDDQEARNRAHSLSAKLRNTFSGEVEFAESWWKFSVLDGKSLRHLAASDVAQADLVLFSLGASNDLPDGLVEFNEMWVSERKGKQGLLAVLAHPSASVWSAAGSLENYFKDLAQYAKLDFITSSMTDPLPQFVEPRQEKLNRDRFLKPLMDGGSSKQARSVIDGLEADVVTMNQALDIDMLHEKGGLVPADWASRLPFNSAPYSSTILFLVRKGNPKAIHDWDDLIKPSVSVIIPNPKTSGNGRYSYLAAWGYALKKPGGEETKAREFITRLFKNVPVLDTGGRGATTTFAQRGIGDVLLTFENEAALILSETGGDKLELIVPSVSILAENPVAWVDTVVKKHGTEEIAKAYLEYLYSDAGQELVAKHHFRPRNKVTLAVYADRFKPIQFFTVNEVAGGWKQAQKTHFDDGGLFDRIYQPEK